MLSTCMSCLVAVLVSPSDSCVHVVHVCTGLLVFTLPRAEVSKVCNDLANVQCTHIVTDCASAHGFCKQFLEAEYSN